MMRKQTEAARMRMLERLEQETRAELTFRPKINRSSSQMACRNKSAKPEEILMKKGKIM
jgi:hypothetical protein